MDQMIGSWAGDRRITNIRGWPRALLSGCSMNRGRIIEWPAVGKANPTEDRQAASSRRPAILFTFSILKVGACSRLFSAGSSGGTCGFDERHNLPASSRR